MKDSILNNKIKFIISLCLVFIIFISSFVIIYDKLFVDEFIYEFLINNFSSSYMDEFMIGITRFANTNFVLLLTMIIFFIILFLGNNKKLSFIFVGCVGGTSFINQILKIVVKRVRPDVNKLIDIGGYSFPSGHAMVSMMLYGLIAYFVYKFIKVKWLRNIIMVINILLILLIGISRIYLGVHYFSDIIVGFLISIILLIFVINLLEKKFFSQN